MANYDYPPKHTCCDAFRNTYRVMWDATGEDYRNPHDGYYLVRDVFGCDSCGPEPEPSGPMLKFCPWCGAPIGATK